MTEKQWNYLHAKSIKQKNKERIKQLCTADINEDSGIYVFSAKKTESTTRISGRQNTCLQGAPSICPGIST